MVNLKDSVFGVQVMGVKGWFILGRVHGTLYKGTLRYLLK